ncbi:MAG: hypothetical protein Q9219_003159 [cf. Caloplaca sp. 3 TL-2023]
MQRPAPRSQRSSSISNDRASLSVATLPFPPAVTPDPAYIAPSSAAQIVTGDQAESFQEDDEDNDTTVPAPVNAWVTPTALSLVNAFLDQLLYSFLAGARSTSIASLRPAITDVLKPRLAKDAIACADAELHEFLGGEDDEELSVFQHGIEPRGQWNLHTIWRRTRLRCMVYTRLGDMEEEDEEMWVERENLDLKKDHRNRLSRDLGVVSPAAAIFLTSILEFVGEQILMVSGKSAYSRFEARRRQEKQSPASPIDPHRPSVEVVDIEKLAVNTTFGRLWRSWKKKVRSPSVTSGRPSSREYLLRPASSMSTNESGSRGTSIGEAREHRPDTNLHQRPSTADMERIREAALIPLPNTADTINERSELPTRTELPFRSIAQRPQSFIAASDPKPIIDQQDRSDKTRPYEKTQRTLRRNRSSSLPPLSPRGYSSLHSQLGPAPSLETFPNSKDGHTHHDNDPVAISSMYDGATLQEQDPTGNSHKAEHTKLSPWERAEMEIQGIERGLEKFMRAWEVHRIPGEKATSRPQQATSSTGSSTDSINDGRQSHRPESSDINEDRDDNLDPDQHQIQSRMQGYGAGNASGITSVAETTARSLDGAKATSRGENARGRLSGPFSDVSYDHFDGAAPAAREFSTPHHGNEPISDPNDSLDPSSASSDQSPTFPQVKPGAKVSEIRTQLPPVSTGVERAAVQRVIPSPGSTLESPVGRTSSSSNRELRSLHTSGSNASQRASKVRGTLGKDPTDTNRQIAASRASSDGSASIAKTPRIDETQRSFEQLIKSDETIQYTLTPQSVREIDLADSIRTSGPPSKDTNRPPSAARSIISSKGLDGFRSNPTANVKLVQMPTSAPAMETPTVQSQRSRPTTSRSTHGGPRDAQLNEENTRDFADFIRSTGPEARPGAIDQKDGAALPPFSKPMPNRAMTPTQRSSPINSTGKKITKPHPSISKSPPPVTSNPSPKRTGPKLQARNATYEPTHNEDLLDFLKQGPSDDRGTASSRPGPAATVVPQNPRILQARTSDNTQSSFGSTQDSTFANQSIRSTNSRTGLLDSPNRPHGPSASPASQRPPRFEEPQPPARKQRRVKDPYAIDTDSEDDIDDERSTPKPSQQTESLMEFLNSAASRENNINDRPKIPSAFDGMPEPSIRTGKSNGGSVTVKNPPTPTTQRTPGIRSAAPTPSASKPQPQHQKQSQPNSHHLAPQLPPLNSSPNLLNTFPPPTATTIHSNNNVVRPTKPHLVARAERDPPRGMGDLADFLRNSEPPTSVPEEFRDGSGGVGGAVGRKRAVEEGGEKEKGGGGGGGGGVWGRLRERGRRKGVGGR